MQIVPLVLVATLVGKIVDLGKYVNARNWNAVVTQAVSFVAGVVAMVLAAHTDFAGLIAFGDLTLADTSVATQVFLGLTATSLFATVYDLKKAIDSGDSATMPKLTGLSTGRDQRPKNLASTDPVGALLEQAREASGQIGSDVGVVINPMDTAYAEPEDPLERPSMVDSKTDWVAYAKANDIPHSGTKAQIIARVNDANVAD